MSTINYIPIGFLFLSLLQAACAYAFFNALMKLEKDKQREFEERIERIKNGLQ